MYIFLDESGDLGFDFGKAGTSRQFVISLLVCRDKQAQDGFRRAVSRTLKNKLNHRKDSTRTVAELKGTGTTFPIKRYFFRQLPKDGWQIYSVTLNKLRVDAPLRSKAGKKKLYNFLARFILEKVHFPKDVQQVSLVVDRCKNKEEIKDFNQYMVNQLEALLPLNARLNIDHLGSHESAGLQAVDLFCWGIARKDGLGDAEWYAVFQDKVSFTTIYLPGNGQ
ncbi:MAG TPA: DUF3800 domain-containing protein [Gallionella sp.]|nr:DUF3800 domain-containing protein [Gallionella sp.]